MTFALGLAAGLLIAAGVLLEGRRELRRMTAERDGWRKSTLEQANEADRWRERAFALTANE